MALSHKVSKGSSGLMALPFKKAFPLFFVILSFSLAGCFSETQTRGFRFQETAATVQKGMSREEVLLTVGTPSTTATFDSEVFYYISQTKQRTAFLAPKIVDQRVLAVTFGKDGRVANIADYGIQDGKVFDFINRRTPTAGRETTFIRQIFTNLLADDE